MRLGRPPAYRRFLALVVEAHGSGLYERDQVPYEGGFLPILRFRAAARGSGRSSLTTS
ncbi:MAG TPA: hypothetical protein VGK74_15515 [Symbiobacteriaceae bacterium]